MQKNIDERYTLRSPQFTIASLVLFFMASGAFMWAQLETKWHIEPRCSIADDELVNFLI